MPIKTADYNKALTTIRQSPGESEIGQRPPHPRQRQCPGPLRYRTPREAIEDGADAELQAKAEVRRSWAYRRHFGCFGL